MRQNEHGRIGFSLGLLFYVLLLCCNFQELLVVEEPAEFVDCVITLVLNATYVFPLIVVNIDYSSFSNSDHTAKLGYWDRWLVSAIQGVFAVWTFTSLSATEWLELVDQHHESGGPDFLAGVFEAIFVIQVLSCSLYRTQWLGGSGPVCPRRRVKLPRNNNNDDDDKNKKQNKNKNKNKNKKRLGAQNQLLLPTDDEFTIEEEGDEPFGESTFDGDDHDVEDGNGTDISISL